MAQVRSDVVTATECDQIATNVEVGEGFSNSVTLGPLDSNLIYAGGEAGMIRIDLTKLESTNLPLTMVRAMAFSPDETFLAANAGQVTSLRDAITGDLIENLQHDEDLSAVAFSPDSSYLATTTGSFRIHIWDLSTKRKVKTIEGHPVAGVIHFGASDRMLLTADVGEVRIWDWRSGNQVTTIQDFGLWTDVHVGISSDSPVAW